MAGKTDIRWSAEEWAALQDFAAAQGSSPGRVAKAVVMQRLGSSVDRGPAAPEERKSSRAAAPAIEREAISGSGLAADGGVLGSGGDLGTGPAAASSRPAGSAGSVGPVPPAGGGAASVVEPPPAADAPTSEGVRLLDAVVSALRARGQSFGVELAARKAIRAGKVVVDGEPCTDPERMVDPRDLEPAA